VILPRKGIIYPTIRTYLFSSILFVYTAHFSYLMMALVVETSYIYNVELNKCAVIVGYIIPFLGLQTFVPLFMCAQIAGN